MRKRTSLTEKITPKKYFLYFFGVISFLFVQALILNFILQYFQLHSSFNDTIQYALDKSSLYLFSTLLIFIFLLFLYALIGRLDLTFILGMLIFTGFGYANSIKMASRFEPIYPEELAMITKFNLLLEFTSEIPIWSVLSIVLILSVLILLVFYIVKKLMKFNFNYLDKKILFTRLVALVTTGFLLFGMYRFNQEGNVFKKLIDDKTHWYSESQLANYDANGVVLGFLYNFPSDAMKIPENYSAETMEKIHEKYKSEADKINSNRQNKNLEDINLIYIMNESFSDPEMLDGISIDKDPIPATREIMEKYSSGYSYATNYGGGTSNIEFEALTSLSINNLTPQTTTPYQMLNFSDDFPNITTNLFGKNHLNTAIHPYSAYMYKRSTVYPKFGFNHFINLDNINNIWGKGKSEFASDESTYLEALEIMEASDNKDFIHIVTMQNHGGWDKERYENGYTVSGLEGKYKEQAEEYVQGIAYSDEAIQKFLTELDTQPEKTMVVFWGDHLPGLYPNEIIENNKKRNIRETPLFIYTNFETERKDLGTISPIFFANNILEISNTKVSPFYALMTRLEEEIKVYERSNIIDSNDKEITDEQLSVRQKELLDDFYAVQYDIISGENYFNNF